MADKLTLDDVSNFGTGSAIGTVNGNSRTIEDEFDKVIYRDGSLDMNGSLDMGSHPIINVADGTSDNQAATVRQLRTIPQGEKGDPGAAGNVAANLAQLQAALTTNVAMYYDGSWFTWTPGNYSTEVNDYPEDYVESDYFDAAFGAWIRNREGQLRAGKVVDVKDFGAVSDGVTDDSASIIAALNTFNDYEGGELIIPENTAISQTIVIQNKKGLIISGRKGLGFEFTGSPRIPTLRWTGASGGKMFQIKNAIHLTMRDLAISGENVADYGLYFEGLNTGWGVGNYNYLTLYGFNKNCVYKGKDAAATLLDFGRNHWLRCTFKSTHVASGTPKNDASFVYDGDSGVQDVFDHCQFIYKSAVGVKVPDTYSLWFESGSPRVILRDCYTVGEYGIWVKTGGPTPILKLVRHYSEDLNFLSLPSANTRQTLEDCAHVLGGGTSILWGGSAGGGAPLVIAGGIFYGTSTLTNTNAPVILSDAPQFVGGWPTISNPEGLVQIGRGTGSAATVTQGAQNAAAFVPYGTLSTTGNINFNLRTTGTFLYHKLTQHATVNAPSSIDANNLDVGREIEYHIEGHASTTYNITSWNAVFKGVSWYVHSGPGITDVLRFRYMSDFNPTTPTYWWQLISLRRGSPPSTGWAADSIAINKDALAALSLPISDPPTQAEVQAVVTALQTLRGQMVGVKTALRIEGDIST